MIADQGKPRHACRHRQCTGGGVSLLPAQAGYVGIIAENDVYDDALLALVEKLGLPARVLDLDSPVTAVPRAVLVRSTATAIRVASTAAFNTSILGLIHDGERGPDLSGVVVIGQHAGASGITDFLLTAFGPRPPSVRVPLSVREREVLTSYTLGATVRETALLYYITESTVRTHYRRVVRRYSDAGHDVDNKAQLLMHLIADGYVSLGSPHRELTFA